MAVVIDNGKASTIWLSPSIPLFGKTLSCGGDLLILNQAAFKGMGTKLFVKS